MILKSAKNAKKARFNKVDFGGGHIGFLQRGKPVILGQNLKVSFLLCSWRCLTKLKSAKIAGKTRF